LIWRIEDHSANRASHQVGQLEAARIRFLVSKNKLELELLSSCIRTFAKLPELQLEFLVFCGSSTLNHDMGFQFQLALFLHEMFETLQGKF